MTKFENANMDKFPHEAIEKIKKYFFETAAKIVNDDPKINDVESESAFLQVALLNIIAETMSIVASQYDDVHPTTLIEKFIEHLKGIKYDRIN